MNMLEVKIKDLLERVSNSEPAPGVTEATLEAAIEQAGEDFKAALRRQFTPNTEPFRLRMSNVGRATCQLQREASAAEPTRRPYNHVMRMIIGDACEAAFMVVLRLAGANITGTKGQAALELAGAVIKGEDDVEIDERVWDVKSASPFAFTHKFASFKALASDDAFGYVGQLVGYARGRGLKPGGWFAINKSTGEIAVVEAEIGPAHERAVLAKMEENVKTINTGAPFKRGYELEDEYYRGRKTGERRLPTACTFCDYLGSCWPDAEYRRQEASSGANPKHYWYAPKEPTRKEEDAA